jgi:hypothetical protein
VNDTGGVSARVSVAGDATTPRRDAVRDDTARAPEPHERPSPHAQWDEVSRRWIEWDPASAQWIPVADGPGRKPGSTA